MERLEGRTLMSAQPVISEILAANDGVIQDVDGDYSDYIELHNRGDQPANLAGWHLTDDEDDLTKWEFPSVNLAPGQYLLVFASTKDQAVAGSELHANFALSADGEYLALVQPDGMTIASEFSPDFPAQHENVSYGLATQGALATVIGAAAPAQALVPVDGSLGTAWTAPGFPSGSWQSGALGVGFSTEQEPPVSTTVLQVDFNDRGSPGNTEPGFSSFVINSGSETQFGLVTRNFGAISVTVSDASGLGYQDRARPAPVDNGAFTDGQLLQDFIFSSDQTGTGGIDVLLQGLTPGAVYTLTAWSFDTGSTGQRVSDWTANGVTVEDYGFDGSSLPSSNDTYRFGLVVTADSLGRIQLQGRRDEASNIYGVFLNALRLETGDTLNEPGGQALRVDFNDRTEGESGAANTEDGYDTMTLDENGATIGGAVITFSAFGGAVPDDRDRTTPLASGGFTLDQVYDDFIFASGPMGGGLEILIEGLAPNAHYDLVLRSLDGLSTTVRQATWTEISSGTPVTIAAPYSYNGANTPTSNDANTMRAVLTTSPQGTLVLRGVQNGSNTSVVVNALELTRANFGELIALDVEAGMHETSSSAYIRIPFAVASLAAVDQLLLDIQYDAGFVAYLNGQEVARRNAPTAPGIPPAFNAAATAERSNSEAIVPETIDLTSFKHLLTQGNNNVLAIHGLNSAASDGDFLVAPQLRTVEFAESSLRYFETPTPGAANNAGVIDFVAAVQTSVAHGFYDAPFSVTLATATAGADIYYTTDGSIPAPGNAAAALYSTPFVVDTTTVLRAAAVKPGFAASPVTTETYIFLDDVLVQDPLVNPNGLVYPTHWQANAPGDYAIDPRVVAQWDDNNPANTDFGIREALKSIPTLSIVMDHDDLWSSSTGIYPNSTSQGDPWRRPGSVELIDPNTGEEFQYNVGVQMHGAASRDNVRLKKHSFRLVFNPEFDGPGRLEFPLFDNSDFADINTVVLKAAFTDSFATRTQTGRYSPLDSTYTRDVWMLDSQRAMGSLAPNATYVHLYINGLYWGLYYPTERTDDAFLASHIGGAEEDWDVIKDFNELFRGNKNAWNAMFALADLLPSAAPTTANAIYQQLQGRNPDGTVNPSLAVHLDMDNLIDYIILHHFAGVEDWPSHNWVAARNRVDPGKGFQFFTWDQEITFDGRFRDRTEASNAFTPAELYFNLRNSPEFKLRFADRVQKHLFNDGALTTAAAQERWQQRADQIEAAIIGESARWGDAREGEVINVPPTTTVPLMTVDLWRDSVADVHDDYIPQSHALAISRYQSDGLFPTISAPAFSQFGGAVLPGFSLNMTSPSGGTIWYTTNGQDPRLLGGAVNTASATAFGANVPINATTTVKARTLVGATWSPLVEATFVVSQGSGGIVISEINYHPHPPTAAELAALPGVQEDDFEFIELVNTHPTAAISLNNMSLAGGLSFTFGNAILAAGERALVVENLAAFQARYGTGHNVLGEWSGGASNSGETIELRNALDNVVMALSYTEASPWSEAADGDGATLELLDPFETPAAELGKWYRWRAGAGFGGSPGAAGLPPSGVVINEVRSHSPAPQTDAIELYNASDAVIDIGGWYLSDSGGAPLKFQIPAETVLPAGEYIVFDEQDFNPVSPPAGQTPFALNGAEGDDVFLVIANGDGEVTTIVDSVHFGAAFAGETFGRVPDGSGRLAPMNQPTLGAANSDPRVGPLVITEINYQPTAPSLAALAIDPSLTAAHLEFIEVHNRSALTVSLTNSRLVGGSTFNFAPGATLGPGQTVLIASFNPATTGGATRAAAFRAHYGISGSTAIVGPFAGALNDLDARLELQIPDAPPPDMPSFIPRVMSDEVLYDNLSPWPTDANGTGDSIHRTAPAAFGNDGGHWLSGTPSPGSVLFSLPPSADFNEDGDVDGTDFLIWQRGLGAPPANATPSNGNADNDQDIDGADLSVWRSQFATALGSPAASPLLDPQQAASTGHVSSLDAEAPLELIYAAAAAESYAAGSADVSRQREAPPRREVFWDPQSQRLFTAARIHDDSIQLLSTTSGRPREERIRLGDLDDRHVSASTLDEVFDRIGQSPRTA